MARHADAHGSVELRFQQGVEHSLVTGIHFGLAGVGGHLPAAHLGLHLLHGQVGALHDAHLDGGTTGLHAPHPPLAQFVRDGVRVGQVGLQHDARRERVQAVVLEHPTEHGGGQGEVAVFLHVEVHELVRRRRCGSLHHRKHRLDQLCDGVVERQRRHVCRDGRQLHRHVVDVGPAELLENEPTALERLCVTEDRFAQHIHVGAHALAPTGDQVPGQGGVFRRKHHSGGVGSHTTLHETHHRSWQHRGGQRPHPQLQSVEGTERIAGRVHHQRPEPARCSPRILDTHHLVGQRDGKVLRGGLAHDARDVAQPTAHLAIHRPRRALGGTQQVCRQFDRSGDAGLVVGLFRGMHEVVLRDAHVSSEPQGV